MSAAALLGVSSPCRPATRWRLLMDGPWDKGGRLGGYACAYYHDSSFSAASDTIQACEHTLGPRGSAVGAIDGAADVA